MSTHHDNRGTDYADDTPRTHEEAVEFIEDEFNATMTAAWNYDECARGAQRPLRETKVES
jgi:hypothetical protein